MEKTKEIYQTNPKYCLNDFSPVVKQLLHDKFPAEMLVQASELYRLHWFQPC